MKRMQLRRRVERAVGRGLVVTLNYKGSLHEMSSRNNPVPASPSPSLTSKCQNKKGIGPDQRAPERPLIKTSGRGNNPYVFYETNAGVLLLRKLLQAPVEINVLTHVEGFIITKQGSVNVSSRKLCRPLSHSCQLPQNPPQLKINLHQSFSRSVIGIHCPAKTRCACHNFVDAPQKLVRHDCVSINEHQNVTFCGIRPDVTNSRNIVFRLFDDASAARSGEVRCRICAAIVDNDYFRWYGIFF